MSVLEVSGLAVCREGRPILQGVSFQADRGERLALMGASGAGKTTVLRAIAALEPLSGGAIAVAGVRLTAAEPASRERARALQRRVGMVFQFHHLFDHLTVLQNVSLAPLHVLKRSRIDAERQAEALLDKLGVAARAQAFPHELSGGEAQRVAIARALAVNPPVLLLDEPTASLDPLRRGDLASTLRQLSEDGTTLLIATHDADFARGCAHRVLVLEEGRITREGAPADVLS